MTPRPQKSPPKPLVEASLEALALHYVGRFATSRGKLTAYLARKLRERGWADDAPPPIERITQKLVDLRYVDDHAYAEMKSGAMQRRGLGQRRIAQTLRQDGIDEALSEQAAPDETAQWDAAERLARRKRIGPFAAEPADRALREKQIATFLRAGHSMQTARNWIESAPGELPERPETLSTEDWE